MEHGGQGSEARRGDTDGMPSKGEAAFVAGAAPWLGLALAGIVLGGCGGGGGAGDDTDPDADAATMDCLFGRPTEKTGLDTDRCSPSTAGWEAPSYGASDLAELSAWELNNPPPLLPTDPYQDGSPPLPNSEGVCGVLLDQPTRGQYRLGTFAAEPAATADGAQLTHTGACGLCSSLEDLAVYLREGDLTGPVRQCGFEGITGGAERNLECLRELGFTEACAQIWLFNTLHTRAKCADVCLTSLNDAYNHPDGSLNECLACDERVSGPIFKAAAGRTRRNSGIPTAICRSCDGVAELEHRYGPRR